MSAIPPRAGTAANVPRRLSPVPTQDIFNAGLHAIEAHNDARRAIEYVAGGGWLDSEELDQLWEHLPPAIENLAEIVKRVGSVWVSADRFEFDSCAASALEGVAKIAATQLAWIEPSSLPLSFVERCRLAIEKTPRLEELAVIAALRREVRAVEVCPPVVQLPDRLADILEEARGRVKLALATVSHVNLTRERQPKRIGRPPINNPTLEQRLEELKGAHVYIPWKKITEILNSEFKVKRTTEAYRKLWVRRKKPE